MSFDANKVCLDEEQSIPNTWKKLRKSQSVTGSYRCGKCAVMSTNVECLSCGEVEDLGYFQLSYMRYDDGNAATRLSTTNVKCPTNLINLNICTNFRTRKKVPEADLRLPQLLRWSSLADYSCCFEATN